MRILHTSDWHLGQNFMRKSRVEVHKVFLFCLLKMINDKQIDVSFVSRDIFDIGTPPNYNLELYYTFLKEFSNIKTFLTATIITTDDENKTIKFFKYLHNISMIWIYNIRASLL